MESCWRPREICRQVGIDCGDGFAQRWPERFRGLARLRTDHDGAELRRRTRTKQRHIETGAIGFAVKRSLHQSVGNDADDRTPGLRLRLIVYPDLMSKRTLVAPIFAREARVYNRHRLFRVAVIDSEIASLENLQPGQVIRVGSLRSL